jgi:hypothetical protein
VVAADEKEEVTGTGDIGELTLETGRAVENAEIEEGGTTDVVQATVVLAAAEALVLGVEI